MLALNGNTTNVDADTRTEKVLERNEAYYAKFPEDVERVREIMRYLATNQVALPSGWLTPARFQQLGIMFGFHG
jgi:proline iminopeptidase